MFLCKMHQIIDESCIFSNETSFTKPAWVLEIILSKIYFILLAIAVDSILYITDKRDMGRQFFRNSLGLFPFGKQVIIHCRRDVDILPVKYA